MIEILPVYPRTGMRRIGISKDEIVDKFGTQTLSLFDSFIVLYSLP